MRTAFILAFLTPFVAFSQGNQNNPPVLQQQVYNFTNVNEVNVEENPVTQNTDNSLGNEDPFVIHTTVQSPNVNVNGTDGQQWNVTQMKMPGMMIPNFTSNGSGSSFDARSKSGFNIKRSILKVDKNVKRICNRHNKRKHTTSRCFSWR